MFIDFLAEQYLTEMPHLVLPSGQVIDLEIERFTKSSSEEFISHLASIISGKPFQTKYGTIVQLKKKEDVEFLKNKLAIDGAFVLPFVKKFHPTALHTFKALVED